MPASLVTGAANGLGAIMAQRLAQQGSDLALIDIDGHGLAVVGAAARSQGVRVTEHLTDVADAEALRRALADVGSEHGSVRCCAPFAGLFLSPDVSDPDAAALVKAVNLDHVETVAEWTQDIAASAGHGSHAILSGSNSGMIVDPVDAYSVSKQQLLLAAQRLRWRGRLLRLKTRRAHRVTLAVIHTTATGLGENTRRVMALRGIDTDFEATEVARLDDYLAEHGRSPHVVIDEVMAAVASNRTSIQTSGVVRTGLRSRFEVDWRIPARLVLRRIAGAL